MCDCRDQVNKMLKQHNTALERNWLNQTDIIIETVKINAKKRGQRSIMFANFCPWCGEKLPRGHRHDEMKTPAAPLTNPGPVSNADEGKKHD